MVRSRFLGDRRGRVLAAISVASGALLVAWVILVLAGTTLWLLLGLGGAAVLLLGVWQLAGRADPRPVIGISVTLGGGLIIAVAVAQTSLTPAVLVSRMSVVLGLSVAAAGFARAAGEARAEPASDPGPDPADPRPDAPESAR